MSKTVSSPCDTQPIVRAPPKICRVVKDDSKDLDYLPKRIWDNGDLLKPLSIRLNVFNPFRYNNECLSVVPSCLRILGTVLSRDPESFRLVPLPQSKHTRGK